jgi:hypothetical protein
MVVMFKLVGVPIFSGKDIVILKHNTNLFMACFFSMQTIPYCDLKHIQGDSKSYGQT